MTKIQLAQFSTDDESLHFTSAQAEFLQDETSFRPAWTGPPRLVSP